MNQKILLGSPVAIDENLWGFQRLFFGKVATSMSSEIYKFDSVRRKPTIGLLLEDIVSCEGDLENPPLESNTLAFSITGPENTNAS